MMKDDPISRINNYVLRSYITNHVYHKSDKSGLTLEHVLWYPFWWNFCAFWFSIFYWIFVVGFMMISLVFIVDLPIAAAMTAILGDSE